MCAIFGDSRACGYVEMNQNFIKSAVQTGLTTYSWANFCSRLLLHCRHI